MLTLMNVGVISCVDSSFRITFLRFDQATIRVRCAHPTLASRLRRITISNKIENPVVSRVKIIVHVELTLFFALIAQFPNDTIPIVHGLDIGGCQASCRLNGLN